MRLEEIGANVNRFSAMTISGPEVALRKLQQKSPVEALFVKNSLETIFGIRYYTASSIPHASQSGLGLRSKI